VSDTRQAPFEGSFRVTALHPRPKAARFYGEFDKKSRFDKTHHKFVSKYIFVKKAIDGVFFFNFQIEILYIKANFLCFR
jgi:hypothetical protein